MKKVLFTLSLLAFLFAGNAFAQFSYDFTGCTAGAKVAQTLGMPWTTWSDAPGGAEDGVFGEIGGSMAAYFTFGNDQVVVLGEKQTGVYDIEFDVYVEEGYIGYFNIMHHYPCNNDQAIQVYLQATNDGQNTTVAPGHGTVHAGSNGTCDLACYSNDWMHFKVHVDCDNDLAQFYFDGQLMCEWQWSLDSFGETTLDRVLGGIDFYPPENASNSRFYVDNVVFTPIGAEQTLIEDSFEEYTVGNKIAAEAVAAGNDWWTTWSNAPGGNEDGVVSNAFASDGVNCGYISGANDQVILLGDESTGVYDYEFDVYTETGMDGYFNILHDWTGSSETSVWAMQAYINATADEQNSTQTHSAGHGTVFAGGGAVADIPCVENEWMHFRIHIDTDNDVATLYYNETEIYTWQWSLDSFGNPETRNIDAGNFFAAVSTSTSKFYIDNVKFTRIGGESAPVMTLSVDAVYEELEEDEFETQTIVIANEGNSIGDWCGYIDFGQGEGGSAQQEMSYDNDNPMNLSGLQTANLMEIANKFPVTSYGGAVMGTKLKNVKYFVAEDSDGILGFTGGLTMRAYKTGANGAPGELLGEVSIPEGQIVRNDWNTATFTNDIWITGYDLFVSVEFQQIDGGYPVTFDDGAMVPGTRYLLIGGSGSWYIIDDIWENSNNNFCLRATCEGTPIAGSWVTMDKNAGSLLGGTEEEITLSFNTIGLGEGEEYNANILIETNDAENLEFEIPITLQVGDNAVVENSSVYNIYPNPTTSKVTIDGENINSVAIYNVAGQLVRVQKLTSNVLDMNVEAGVYFLNIIDNNGNSTVQRVVVE